MEVYSDELTRFVKRYNKQHRCYWATSVQYQMHRILKDIERLKKAKESMLKLYEAQRQLYVCTKAFIDTETLNNIDVNRVFLPAKKLHWLKLEEMKRQNPALLRESIQLSILFDEHLEEFQQAYQAKEATLICLRKHAKEELMHFFDVYALLLSLLPLGEAIDGVCVLYLELIFRPLVMINEHLLFMAFKQLRFRVRGVRK